MTSHPFFLNVEQSFLGASWRERLDAGGLGQALALSQHHGLSDLLARVLAGRGVTVESCSSHMAPTLRALMPDPDTVVDMPAAVERLAAAVTRRERVAVFGDYDVDGATSAALLASYLRRAGLDPMVHIPDRVSEGYGPNGPAIGRLAQAGATLLVTVDCGTGSPEALTEARRLGLDTVVIDHHRATAALPPAVAVVNANRQDDLSGLGHLCAAGMVFMVLVALQRRLKAQGFWNKRPLPDLLAELDLVALGTVADVVPLTGLNRAFVAQGLAVMRDRARPGLRALFDVAGADGPPTAYHLGFLIGPRINAGGRIGDAALGARLLMTDDPVEAARIAADLDRLNRERRVVEGAAVDEAEADAILAFAGDAPEGRTVVCAGESWHPGVVGLVASRLRERFNRPCFALAVDGARATGSGRSIPGVDLGRVVHEAVASGLLIKGGGHAMAAGVTLMTDRIDAFRAFLDSAVGDAVAQARQAAALQVDAVLTARALTTELVGTLDGAGPFGAGNPEPVIALATHQLRAVQPVGTDHLRLTVEAGDGARLSAIAFRSAGTALGEGLRAALGRPVHLAGTLTVNRHGGAGRAELRVLDAALA
ncbi:single-stranded-DNA-specific exonuclease RecJ [Lichenihabitans sp. Uapishka_5]|uniref:single-stranded-DNA-specific exonuclease RecJ n=1 Tax=Lichenihabitans sp. Uapishka_5 TaxID=3037302 RepID=UPI0029E82207|nr:single-stranded-DNA-specific exonuclease RecJ [Lichenihabitans sp. Uapishka_5]MDX7950991.1 single-stranded-DNA-specific exonuclease RecJ [Lichenihabitans sp. Uapishka_5]